MLTPAALLAQSVPANGPTSRNITTELDAELQRACKKIDQSVSPAKVVAMNPCPPLGYPARVRVGGVEVNGAIPPLLLTVPNIGGKMFVEVASGIS